MAKDLIIGGASNYTYNQVKYWINSISRSGFDGDIVLVVTNMRHEDLVKIAERGVNILAYGQRDEFGNVINANSKLAPHVERFFYLWNFLTQCDPYRYVITTDVRDVVFQANPSDYLEKYSSNEFIIAAGEGLIYDNEPWGKGNYELAFGPLFYNRMKDNQIANVGVIGGTHDMVRDMLLMIYQLSINRPFEVVDQAVYNFIINVNTIAKNVRFSNNDEGWACNLGTTIPAIKSGHGDIGRLADDNYMNQYNENYIGAQPIISGDLILANDEDPFVIVHQYDRVNGLKEKIMSKFDD